MYENTKAIEIDLCGLFSSHMINMRSMFQNLQQQDMQEHKLMLINLILVVET